MKYGESQIQSHGKTGFYRSVACLILLFALLWSGCAAPSKEEHLLYRLDLAVGTRHFDRARDLAERLGHARLTRKQRCTLNVYMARYSRLNRDYKAALERLDRVKYECCAYPDISAWGMFELGLIAEVRSDAAAIRVFRRVLVVYPDTAAAHPALFELLAAAKRTRTDPSGVLEHAYKLHPDSEMAAEFLANLARLGKGRSRRESLDLLARRFPGHPLGARARFELLKPLEKRDPVTALEGLYDLAFGTEKSLFVGSYATGMEGTALLEAARVWDRYMDDPGRAERDYRRFIRLYPASSKVDDALYAVYKMYMRRGNKTKAMRVLKELATRFPDRARGMQAVDMLKGKK